MNLLDLVRDPLLRSVLMVFWLLPCAIQDRRTRRVSNWLTVPLFLLAWPIALLLGNFPLTLATFAGVYVAFRMGAGLGPADGKIAVGMAGIVPLGLIIGVTVQSLVFLFVRLRRKPPVPLPGAVGFYLGAVSATLIHMCLDQTSVFF